MDMNKILKSLAKIAGPTGVVLSIGSMILGNISQKNEIRTAAKEAATKAVTEALQNLNK